MAALLLISPRQVSPRFYRTQFLTVLGLAALSSAALFGSSSQWFILAAICCAFVGSIAWSIQNTPGGRSLIGLELIVLVGALAMTALTGSGDLPRAPHPGSGRILLLADTFSSAFLLGMATSAMLVGHSYLIAPTMSMRPLLTLLAGLGIALLLRLGIAGIGLRSWTAGHSLVNLGDETVLWLPVRWLLGIILPLMLGLMAWRTARIRSTQSATGILYVVVIFCFLGELTSLLLLATTGFAL